MRRRGLRLSPWALALAAVATLALAGRAQAHRLEADYRLLPGRRIQIESWFDLGGEAPKGAEVRVFGAGGTLLAEGRLGADGTFTFAFAQPEPLRVEISAGAGHKKELLIPKERLETDGGGAALPGRFADRSARISAADVFAGVAFLLALAAFVLSVRNARRLRALQERFATPPPHGDSDITSRGE